MKIAITNDINFKANKMSNMQANYVNRELKNAKNVDIICHSMTDRDGANSALAMWEYLNSLGVNARIIMEQKNPQLLGLRNYDCNIVQASQKDEINSLIPDIAFCVDFGERERIKPHVLSHIKQTSKIMGFDHHSNQNIAGSNCITFNTSLNERDIPETKVGYYTDTTARSATSIVYRFFEALGEDIDNNRAYDLFSGLVDDGVKKGIISCNGETGEIIPKKEIIRDKNAFEVYSKLKEKLTDEQVSAIAKNIDIISSLNEEQKSFKNSLEERIKFSKNGKIAYVEISPDDKEWKKLGGDNTITSTILNRFRTGILANPKYDDVQMVMTFYEANGAYRMSAHSKDVSLLDYFKYVENNAIPDFTKHSGGHANRAGGGIIETNPKRCHRWVQKIISCDECLEKEN
ncbi:DHH family phosphoesterase [bacterium]|nr:DHH family phosphoesterase [bacterium]